MNVPNKKSQLAQSGLSLVELMIAITLSMIIMMGLTVIVVYNIRATDELERSNQQIENGRFAIQLLTDELRNAGYFGEFNLGVMTAPTSKPDPCSTTLSTINSAIPLIVQGYYRGASAPSCLSDVKANTAILVVRRASTCAIGDTNCDAVVTNAPYFQASSCNLPAELGAAPGTYSSNYYALDTTYSNLTRHTKDCTTAAPIHAFFTRVYFVANNDKSGDGIPTLKRAEIGNPASPGAFTIVPVVEGIEDLQIEYGIDNPAAPTGVPSFFTPDPDSYNSCSSSTSPTCTQYWQNTVEAKIHLLARNITQTTGYSSGKTFAMGLDSSGSAVSLGPYTTPYKRHMYESTVRLNNVAARNTP